MKRANQKVYADKDKNLVPAGDLKATVLVATEGSLHPDSIVNRYKNADEYFDDMKPEPKQAKAKVEPKAKARIVKPPE